MRRSDLARRRRAGLSLIEVLLAVGIIALLLALILPAVQQSRVAARRMHCLDKMRQIGVALSNYHDQNRVLPPFVVWSGPPGEPLGQGKLPVGGIDRIARGLAPGSEPDRTYANWAIMLLPFLDQGPLYQKYNPLVPVSAVENTAVRTAELDIFKCPNDTFNGSEKYYQRDYLAGTDVNRYARGNYGMNIGPDNGCVIGLSPNCVDGFTVDNPDLSNKNMTLIGSGIGGVNVSITLAEVTVGLSNMAGVDELRAGIHPADPRGAWALGFIGASGTARHGLLGPPKNDGGGPNNQYKTSDDIVGCKAIKKDLGEEAVAALRMPCFEVGNSSNGQATARSQHPNGVNVLMLDGSAHFVSDTVNLDIWYNMHKRNSTETFELPF